MSQEDSMFATAAAPRPQPSFAIGVAAFPPLVEPRPLVDRAVAGPLAVTSTGWRSALAFIAFADAAEPLRVVLDRNAGVDAALSMTFASIGDMQGWLTALDVPNGEVSTREQARAGVPGLLVTARPHRFGLQLRLTAWEPTCAAPGASEEELDEVVPAVPPLDDLTDVAEALRSSVFDPEPAAPAPVMAAAGGPVDGGDQARSGADREAAAGRRVKRWADLAGGLVIGGCPPPLSATVSEDGWRIQLTVADEAAVRAWGRHLGIEDSLMTRVYSPRRGVVERAVMVSRTHPWAVEVSATATVEQPAPVAVDAALVPLRRWFADPAVELEAAA
jgi:hypothetical protein